MRIRKVPVKIIDRFERWVEKQGVRLVCKAYVWFECVTCGQRWLPKIKEGEKILTCVWGCPYGCKAPRRM